MYYEIAALHIGASPADKLLELQCAETDAVEAEDFERAGQLSQESGQLQGKIKSLYNTQTQAESALYNAVCDLLDSLSSFHQCFAYHRWRPASPCQETSCPASVIPPK